MASSHKRDSPSGALEATNDAHSIMVKTTTTITTVAETSSALAELRRILPSGGPGRLVNSFVFAGHAGALEFQREYRIEMQRLYCLPEPTYRLTDHFDEDLDFDRVNPPDTERRLSGLFPLMDTGYRTSLIADINNSVVRGDLMPMICKLCGDPIQIAVEFRGNQHQQFRPRLLSPSSWKNVAGWDSSGVPILYTIAIDVLSKPDRERAKKHYRDAFDELELEVCGSCFRADDPAYLRPRVMHDCRVAVVGLKAKPQFNGKLGTCVPATKKESFGHGSYRHKVELDEGGKPVLLKPENARVLEPWRQAEKDTWEDWEKEGAVVSAAWTGQQWVHTAYLEEKGNRIFDDTIERWYELDRRFGNNAKRGPWRKMTNDADIHELEEVVQMLHDAAHQGYSKAQCHLGFMYADGNGVDQSDALAVEYCRKAADQGYATAQSNLGRMYHCGLNGVGQSAATAVEWYRKAAVQGHEGAQTNLGFMYSKGIGVDQNYPMALKWFRRAASQGCPKAQLNLSVMYSTGEGVPELDTNEWTGVQWLRKAAKKGYADACYKLGAKYRDGSSSAVSPSDTLAMEWSRKAADQGHPKAQCDVGAMYASGMGVDEDMAEALRWFRKAEAQGESDVAPRSIQWVLRRAPQLEGIDLGAPQPPAPAPARDTWLPVPPKAPPPISIDDFCVNDDVEVRGLQSRPELNGQRGVVMSVDVASERCLVKLHNGSGPFRLKPDNLYFV